MLQASWWQRLPRRLSWVRRETRLLGVSGGIFWQGQFIKKNRHQGFLILNNLKKYTGVYFLELKLATGRKLPKKIDYC